MVEPKTAALRRISPTAVISVRSVVISAERNSAAHAAMGALAAEGILQMAPCGGNNG